MVLEKRTKKRKNFFRIFLFSYLHYNIRMILLIGASASGKTEISKFLGIKFGIIKAITHTTRAPRPGEIFGLDYYFVDEESFAQLEKRGAFVETTLYNGCHYGCSKDEISDDKVVIVDPNGLKAFNALKDPSIVSFYLEASEKTREERMKKRGDSPENIAKRLENDRTAFSQDKIADADYVINTDKKTLLSLTKDIYSKYLKKLKERGIKNPNIVVK